MDESCFSKFVNLQDRPAGLQIVAGLPQQTGLINFFSDTQYSGGSTRPAAVLDEIAAQAGTHSIDHVKTPKPARNLQL